MSAARRLTERARAKVNLDLRVLGRRSDGYHLLESRVVFADMGDVVHAELATEISFNLTGEFADAAGAGEGNLVLRAANSLRAATGTTYGAILTLEKNIPVGAGLGGGSADAAATLRLLNRLWNTGLDEAALRAIAAPLGADVAMCLASVPVIAQGIGEIVTPLEAFPRAYAVLAHPRAPLLTAEVYRALVVPQFKPATQTATQYNTYKDVVASLQQTGNDLQAPAITVCPAIAELLQALAQVSPTPDLVRMTGSGACCFALYETHENAATAAHALAQDHPQWWVRAVTLGE